MSRYAGFRAGITPVAGVANWVLETVSGVMAAIKEVTFSGEVTTSTAMRTRIARDSAVGTGARTAGDLQKRDMHSPTNAAFFSTTYASTQPTIVAGAVFACSWNAQWAPLSAMAA